MYIIRVVILRTKPAVFGKELSKEIGAPQDYTKNKEADRFPDMYDLRVPGASRPEFDERMEVEVNAASPVKSNGAAAAAEERKDS